MPRFTTLSHEQSPLSRTITPHNFSPLQLTMLRAYKSAGGASSAPAGALANSSAPARCTRRCSATASRHQHSARANSLGAHTALLRGGR
eukprot:1172424-Rhodomonas_salina.2